MYVISKFCGKSFFADYVMEIISNTSSHFKEILTGLTNDESDYVSL